MDFRPFHHFLDLVYPNLCLACWRHLSSRRDVLCLHCAYQLPQTRYHLEPDNPFTERFWGRLRLEQGAALFHYVKGGRVQKLVHQLKYGGRRDVGRRLGERYGRQLAETPHFREIDLIVPVPLHPRKKHRRGYNQSDLFAAGLAESLSAPWRPDVLRRTTFTDTQTSKSRLERLENVLQAFELADEPAVAGKHVLLVDDVMTTGATLEACGLRLLAAPGLRLSMVTIAIAAS